MIQKVYYAVKSNLHYYPPCISQIRILHDLGVDVTVLYGSSDPYILNVLQSEGINCVPLTDPRGKFPGKFDKIHNWLSFRKALKAFLSKTDMQNAVLWFGNAETLMPMLGALNSCPNYIITYLELLDTHPLRLKLLRNVSQRALAVVTCEETRSYIMQYWFKLNQLPYTLPNKPYHVAAKKHAVPTTAQGQKILQQVNGRKYVIYQGIFQNVEYLEVVAKVLKDHYPDHCFVMMGIDRNGIADHIKHINPNTICSAYIPAPLHLEITSNAQVGLLFYHPDSLNKAFCAPNKIFEYAYFGLPIIGNRIPGLTNTIGRANAGICTNFTYEEIRAAFHKIFEDYESYSNHALAFYESVDNVKTTRQIITDANIAREEQSL